MTESEELKSLVMKVKEESEKVGLKFNIQKIKIMASGPITSWQIDGETMETVEDFIFLGSNIPADGDCSHEIKEDIQMTNKHMKRCVFSHYQRNANQNHNEVPLHASQDGCYPKVYKQ